MTGLSDWQDLFTRYEDLIPPGWEHSHGGVTSDDGRMESDATPVEVAAQGQLALRWLATLDGSSVVSVAIDPDWDISVSVKSAGGFQCVCEGRRLVDVLRQCCEARAVWDDQVAYMDRILEDPRGGA